MTNEKKKKKTLKRKLHLEILEVRQLLSAVSVASDGMVADEAFPTPVVSNASMENSLDVIAESIYSAANVGETVQVSNPVREMAVPQEAFASYSSNLQALSGGSLSATSVTKGTYVTIKTGTIKNVGSSTSNAGTVKFYASTNSTITTSDIYLGQASLSSLKKNASKTVQFKASTSQLASGKYYIGWIVQSSNDSTTSNNTAVCRSTLTIKGPTPTPQKLADLQASSGGSLSATSVAKGTYVTIKTGTIKNVGSSTSSAGTVKFYASTNSSITTSDTYLGQASLSSLAKNSSKVVQFKASTSQLASGTYYIGWIVQSSNDSTTSNNTAVCRSTLTIKGSPSQKLAAPTMTLYAGYKKITVGWVNKAHTQVYMIAYRAKGASSWKNIYVYDQNGSWIDAGFYTITGLTAGKTYEFKMGACSTYKTPGYSNSNLTSVKSKAVLTSTKNQRSYSNTFVDYNISRNSYYIDFY